jgi:hypothetical protein
VLQPTPYLATGNHKLLDGKMAHGCAIQDLAPTLTSLVDHRALHSAMVPETLPNRNWVRHISGGLTAPAIQVWDQVRDISSLFAWLSVKPAVFFCYYKSANIFSHNLSAKQSLKEKKELREKKWKCQANKDKKSSSLIVCHLPPLFNHGPYICMG